MGQRGSMPIILEVLKETEGMYITREVFSVNLRDMAATYVRKKQVRWNRATGKRMGDRDPHTQFRIKQIHTELSPELLKTAMIIPAE